MNLPTYTTQAELRARGWSALRCLHLGTPDCVLLDGAQFPAVQYPALRAQHGARAQRAWLAHRVQAAQIRQRIFAEKKND